MMFMVTIIMMLMSTRRQQPLFVQSFNKTIGRDEVVRADTSGVPGKCDAFAKKTTRAGYS